MDVPNKKQTIPFLCNRHNTTNKNNSNNDKNNNNTIIITGLDAYSGPMAPGQ